MTRPVRVAAVMDTAIISGPGRQLAAVAPVLRDLGVELTVVTFQRAGRPASPYPEFLRQAGVPHRVIPDRGATDVGAVARLREVLAELRPDVVQTHSYRPAALILALRAAGARRPWIAFFHGVTTEDAKVRLYNWLDRRMLRFADRVVVMSRAQRERFAALGDRVRLIHNAVVSPPAAYAAGAAIALPPALRRPAIGVVGRLSSEKGVDVMLRALALLRDRGAFAGSLLLAGDGPERAALERLAAERALGDVVHFLGTVHPISALYPHLDLLAIPSRSEGLPNVLLEALAADRPVVATTVGAIPEVLEERDAGVLVPPGDPAALADGIARALAEGESAAARAARRRAVDRFSLARRAAAHRALYDEVLAGWRVAAGGAAADGAPASRTAPAPPANDAAARGAGV